MVDISALDGNWFVLFTSLLALVSPFLFPLSLTPSISLSLNRPFAMQH